MKCLEIDSSTKLLGVLGEKISYSLSPRIHNFSFNELGIGAVYVVFDVPRENFQRVFPGLLEIAYGINVTIPYKENVIPYLDDLSGEAAKIGAVNTIHEKRGHNTDYLAVKGLIASKTKEISKVLVLGAGGASRAASFALGEMGAEVTIVNRTRERGEELVSKLKGEGIRAKFADNCEGDYDVVVNTIPDPEGIPVECVKGKVAVEFVYKEETPFLRRARELKMMTVDGLEILVRQAMEAQKNMVWEIS